MKTVGTPLEDRLLDALRDVEDPELPVSIVDLGLVIEINYSSGNVALDLTFTAMGCPAMELLVDDVRQRLLTEPEVESVVVRIVWEPIWTKERLSEDGKAELRAWGISV